MTNRSSAPAQPLARRRVALVTNNPPPYRVPVFNAVSDNPAWDVHFIFSAAREPDRAWDFDPIRFKAHYLRERYVASSDTFIHFNIDVWKVLREIRPELVFLNGFNPTNILAFLYARMHGAALGMLIDGTISTELRLSRWHRLLRRWMYPHIDTFAGPSEATLQLYEHYGAPRSAMFKSHLCANNAAYGHGTVPQHAKADLIFCARFIAEKSPSFALQVADGVARRLGRAVSILMVGSGPLDDSLREEAKGYTRLHVEFPGFAKQAELPGLYARARVLLFPTVRDAWGVVANEACASGVPVVVTPTAGVAGELVVDGDSGYVRPLGDLQAWVDAATQLLSDQALYDRMSARSRELVAEYTFDNAARGLADAIGHGLDKVKPHR
jgi:glycosyltransferase involved in cell wall biosynthesis